MLSISKQIVLEEFLIVGILEQFDSTLMALEALVPGYFEGALEISKNRGIQSSCTFYNFPDSLPSIMFYLSLHESEFFSRKCSHQITRTKIVLAY